MENKIDFQFGPVFANQTCPNYSVALEARWSRNPVWPMDYIHQNGSTVKNVKRYLEWKNVCAEGISFKI